MLGICIGLQEVTNECRGNRGAHKEADGDDDEENENHDDLADHETVCSRVLGSSAPSGTELPDVGGRFNFDPGADR